MSRLRSWGRRIRVPGGKVRRRGFSPSVMQRCRQCRTEARLLLFVEPRPRVQAVRRSRLQSGRCRRSTTGVVRALAAGGHRCLHTRFLRAYSALLQWAGPCRSRRFALQCPLRSPPHLCAAELGGVHGSDGHVTVSESDEASEGGGLRHSLFMLCVGSLLKACLVSVVQGSLGLLHILAPACCSAVR